MAEEIYRYGCITPVCRGNWGGIFQVLADREKKMFSLVVTSIVSCGRFIAQNKSFEGDFDICTQFGNPRRSWITTGNYTNVARRLTAVGGNPDSLSVDLRAKGGHILISSIRKYFAVYDCCIVTVVLVVWKHLANI